MFGLKRKIGNQAEDYALKYLKKQKLKLVKRNYLSALGEIDLVMLDQRMLVFIEVRFRQQNTYGGALASVDKRKRHKLIKTAELFLIKHPQYQHFICRFDIIAIQDRLRYDNILWVKNAFQR